MPETYFGKAFRGLTFVWFGLQIKLLEAKQPQDSPAEASEEEEEEDDDEEDEEETEKWSVERDDAAVLRFAKGNREGWKRFLGSMKLLSVGADPTRHTPANRRRFWRQEQPLPAAAFNPKKDEKILRNIAATPKLR
eukprot:COSAG04_NODE_1376_length_7017_cov_3.776814_2_plen_136_part_00